MVCFYPMWIWWAVGLCRLCSCDIPATTSTQIPVSISFKSTSANVTNATIIPVSAVDQLRLNHDAPTPSLAQDFVSNRWIRHSTSFNQTPVFPWNTKIKRTTKHPTRVSTTYHSTLNSSSAGNSTEDPRSNHQSRQTTRRASHSQSGDTFSYHWDKENTNAEDFLLGFNPGECTAGRYVTKFNEKILGTFPCECGSGCEMYGTCCPNNATDLVSASYTGCTKSGWYVIAKCPAGWTGNDSVRDCCEKRIQQVGRKGGYPIENPVSDPSTKVTYRNEFCALCHGVSSFTRWPVNVSCSSSASLTSATSERELLRLALASPKRCVVGSSPPLGSDPRPCDHRKWFKLQFLDRCNPKLAAADKDIAANCGRYKALILQVRRSTVYQNLFCALCNGVTLVRNGTHPPAWTKERPAPFSVLLGLKGREVDRGEHRERECQPGQWLNFKKVCQTLECTAGKIPKNSTCVTAVSAIRGLSYHLNMTLGPSQPLLTSHSNRSEFHTQLKQHVLEKLVKFARFIRLSLFFDSSPLTASTQVESALIWPSVVGSAFSKQTNSQTQVEEVLQVRVTGEIVARGNMSRDEFEAVLVHILFHSDWTVVLNDTSTCLTPRYSSQAVKARITASHQLNVIYRPARRLPELELLVPLTSVLTCPYLRFNQSQYEFRATGDRGDNLMLVLTEADVEAEVTDVEAEVTDVEAEVTDVEVEVTDVEAEVTDVQHTWLEGDMLYVCHDALKTLRRLHPGSSGLNWQYVLTMVVTGLSMLCLLLTLAVYCLLPALRTQPGLNTMCTCIALLLAQLSLLGAHHAHGTTARPWCRVLGAVVHAAWLNVFCWTSICSVHMFRAFSAQTYHREPSSSSSSSWHRYKETACNISVSLLVSAAVVGMVVVASFVSTNGRSVGYSGVRCYLESTLLVGLSMVLPMSLLLLSNLTLFALTVHRINQVTQLHIGSEIERDSKHYVYTCARLSLLTGVTWVISLVAEGLNFDWLQVLSILTNGGQGVLLLVYHVTTPRVVAMLTVRLKS